MPSARFTTEDLRLLVDQAHRHGLPVTAHAHAASALDQAVAVGVDGIEHASYLVRQPDRPGKPGLAGLTDSHATDRQLQDLADSRIAVCPTLGGLTADNLRRVPLINRLTAEAGITVEEIVESRMSLLRRMAASAFASCAEQTPGSSRPRTTANTPTQSSASPR